ncbi:MAG: hypothetical protein KAG14_01700 [Mycoplasmataceae bacterium]|nr:hypothetical protein [Mycoplasmataceae bacterium]
MNNWNGAMFDTIGTNISSYVSKFVVAIKNSKKISIDTSSGECVLFDENGKEIMNLKSLITGKQFIASLEAYGMIQKSIGGYIVLHNAFNFHDVTNAIFEYSNDKKVQKIRQSRIISFLAKINVINAKNFDSLEIKGVRGNTKYEAVIREISMWEKEAGNDISNITIVLERIKNYEFKRKI